MQFTSSILIFLVGAGFGVLLRRFVFGRKTQVGKLEKEIMQLKGEQLQLKDSVQNHFHQTADLTQNLTQSYKDLYEHLAKGASQFSAQPLSDLKQALEQAKEDSPKDYVEPEAAEALEFESKN